MVRLKIAFFVSNLNKYSGAAFQALTLAKNINHIADIIFFNRGNESCHKVITSFNGFTVVNLSSHSLYRLVQIFYYTLTFKIKLFHIHGFFRDPLLTGVILNNKIILKTTLLGEDDFDSLLKRKFGILNKYLINRIDKNIALSQRLYNINKKYIESEKIQIIPNGVVLPIENHKNIKTKDYCTVGIIHPRKRTLEAIKFFGKNISHDKEAKLYVVGPLNNEENLSEFNNDYILECKKTIKDLNLVDQVIFTGKLCKEELNKIYEKTFGLIFFSDKEGMPNVVLEAMSYNCVPILSEIGGVAKEIVDHEDDGLILSEFDGNIELDMLLAMSKKQKPMMKIRAYFDIKIIASQYVHLYNEIR